MSMETNLGLSEEDRQGCRVSDNQRRDRLCADGRSMDDGSKEGRAMGEDVDWIDEVDEEEEDRHGCNKCRLTNKRKKDP